MMTVRLFWRLQVIQSIFGVREVKTVFYIEVEHLNAGLKNERNWKRKKSEKIKYRMLRTFISSFNPKTNETFCKKGKG